MNALDGNPRRQRRSQPLLESLDSRIVLSAIQPGVGTEAAAAVASVQLQNRQKRLLERRIERQETVVERHELRLARLEARIKAQYLKHHGASALATSGAVASTTGPQLVALNNLGSSSISAPAVSSTGTPNPPAAMVGSTSGSATSSTGSVTGSTSQSTGASTGSTGTGTNSASQPLPANAAVVLDVIYTAYEQSPSDFPDNLPTEDGANLVVIQGDDVGIQVHDSNPSDFSTLVTELQSAGMQITISSSSYGTIVGMLPIAQLPSVAASPRHRA